MGVRVDTAGEQEPAWESKGLHDSRCYPVWHSRFSDRPGLATVSDAGLLQALPQPLLILMGVMSQAGA